jgi:hypothetical protein
MPKYTLRGSQGQQQVCIDLAAWHTSAQVVPYSPQPGIVGERSMGLWVFWLKNRFARHDGYVQTFSN